VYDQQALSIMTVLLFGAGTDYCLFLISRYRSELQEHANIREAIRIALGGTTGAIAMSGFTTMIALTTLLLAQYGAVQRFAVPFGLCILVMGVATLTIVPALLAIFGRASFYPFVPRTPEMQRERAQKRGKPVPAPRSRRTPGQWLSELAVRRAGWVTAASLVGLLVLAAFSAQVKFTFDTLSSFPDDMPSREGFAVISDAFSPGQLAPVTVIVDTEGKSVPAKEELEALPFVAKVGEPASGTNDADIVSYSVELTMNPYSEEAMDALPDIRAVVLSAAEEAGVTDAEERVWLAGQTATQFDTRETTFRDELVIIPVVIGLIALLLLAYLRSLVAMAYLIATVVLSYFSALGLGWLVIHYGLGADAIQGFIPLYAFVFLVALGEDYNIFMVSSIWKKARKLPLRQAIEEGASQTGGVITSAGVILAGTFAVLATLPIQILVHFGIITAIGVLLDTFVVRPFLVPAITALLGRRAFWPGKLEEIEESNAAPSKQMNM
jgi:RND superfamily putative drug exporter